GAVYPDHLLAAPGVGVRKTLLDAVDQLRPGVTEVYLHPAIATPELQALTPDWEARVDDYELLTDDQALAPALQAAGVTLIGYRVLRQLLLDS
ncbi:MAG TPA: hypothetical protein VEJ21_02250, partial [Acidimicrobiales bacterium]|nr:hypothetical protein [Acidimicrobiales bacterium]